MITSLTFQIPKQKIVEFNQVNLIIFNKINSFLGICAKIIEEFRVYFFYYTFRQHECIKTVAVFHNGIKFKKTLNFFLLKIIKKFNEVKQAIH